MQTKAYWLIGALSVLVVASLLKGCADSQPSSAPAAPAEPQPQKVVVRLASAPSNLAAKATGLRLDAVGLNDRGEEAGPQAAPVIIAAPDFPCLAELILYRPPCRYKLSLSANLSRDPVRIWTDVADICKKQSGDITIDVFEQFQLAAFNITAPEAVNAGEAAAVSCQLGGLSAPDSADYPLAVTLREQAAQGQTATQNQITADTTVAGTFPDPFPVTLPSEERRLFTCSVTDGRSTGQTVAKTIVRILSTPTPTPMPTPTPTSAPMPTAIPTSTPIPGATPTPAGPTPTPTPTPIPTPPQIIVDNTATGVAPNCGLSPYPNCQTIQDGINAAYASGGNGIEVRFTGIDYTLTTAIQFTQVQGIRLTAQTGVKVRYTADWAVAVGLATGNSLIEISGFEFIGTGIAVAGGNVTIENNKFTITALGAVGSIGGGLVVVRGNTINGGSSGAVGCTNGSFRIENNQITINTATAIYIGGCNGVEILNNVIIAQSALAVNVVAVNSLTLDHNTIQVFGPFPSPVHISLNANSARFQNANQFIGALGTNISLQCGSVTSLNRDNTNTTDGTITGCAGVGLPNCATPPCSF